MLNPSRVDNTPNSVLEALASGVPIVSTDVGGVPFIVEPRTNRAARSAGGCRADGGGVGASAGGAGIGRATQGCRIDAMSSAIPGRG